MGKSGFRQHSKIRTRPRAYSARGEWRQSNRAIKDRQARYDNVTKKSLRFVKRWGAFFDKIKKKLFPPFKPEPPDKSYKVEV